MRIGILGIGKTEIRKFEFGKLSTTEISFSSETIRGNGPVYKGDAYIYKVMATTDQFNIGELLDPAIGYEIEMCTSVEKIRDFVSVGVSDEDSIVTTDRPNEYLFTGCIIEHFSTGEGSLFQSGDTFIEVWCEMVGIESLNFVAGRRVSFRASGLGFWFPPASSERR